MDQNKLRAGRRRTLFGKRVALRADPINKGRGWAVEPRRPHPKTET